MKDATYGLGSTRQWVDPFVSKHNAVPEARAAARAEMNQTEADKAEEEAAYAAARRDSELEYVWQVLCQATDFRNDKKMMAALQDYINRQERSFAMRR